jgi:hypothetical protein
MCSTQHDAIPELVTAQRMYQACLHAAIIFTDPVNPQNTRVTGIMSIPDELGVRDIPSIHEALDRDTHVVYENTANFLALFLGVLGAKVIGED